MGGSMAALPKKRLQSGNDNHMKKTPFKKRRFNFFSQECQTIDNQLPAEATQTSLDLYEKELRFFTMDKTDTKNSWPLVLAR